MSQAIDIPVQEGETKRHKPFTDFFIRLWREKPLGTLGAAIVLILLLTGILADFLAPYGMSEIHMRDMLEPPSAEYLLGTDQLGRDILSRIIYGARVSVVVGLATTSIIVLVAAIIGIPSGFFGGKYDIIIQRFVDAWMAFPGLIILLTVMSIVGRGLLQIILVMGILGGIGSSRIIRSAVISIKENTYFTAAEVVGSPTPRTILRHIFPNIMAPVVIIFSTSIGGVILAEAGLSFLGFGLPPDVASWGGMLSGEGRMYMEIKPDMALWPGLCLSIVVYGVNMFGDAARDLMDPRLRGGVGHYSGMKRKKTGILARLKAGKKEKQEP